MIDGIIGVRFRKGCHPKDLWTKYFTSSDYVKKFREENGEPDVVEIDIEFTSINEATNYESLTIKFLNATNSMRFLNKKDPNGSWNNTDSEIREKMRKPKKDSSKMGRYKRTEEHRKKLLEISGNCKGRKFKNRKPHKPHSQETKDKIRLALAGVKKDPDVVRKISDKRRGVPLGPMSIDHKNKISESLRSYHENIRNGQ